jgi:hypothetical protein
MIPPVDAQGVHVDDGVFPNLWINKAAEKIGEQALKGTFATERIVVMNGDRKLLAGCAVGAGDDDLSWAVDGDRMSKWHGVAGAQQPFGTQWRAGDVVGLACDLSGAAGGERREGRGGEEGGSNYQGCGDMDTGRSLLTARNQRLRWHYHAEHGHPVMNDALGSPAEQPPSIRAEASTNSL